MQNWRQILDEKGYLLLENILDADRIEITKNAISKENVNIDMLDFTKYMIKKISDTLQTNIDFHKYRLSNNSNFVDASGFHRDVQCLKDWNPIMTCLTYLDDTDMEIIEGSHKSKNLSYKKAVDFLTNNRKTVHIKSGNVLVFYATLLHRGVFSDLSKNRRLLQVFDCFEIDKPYDPEMVSILGDNSTNKLSVFLNSYSIPQNILNMGSYFNFASGTSEEEDEEFAEKIRYSILSSEGAVGRWEYVPYAGEPQPLNKYVINPTRRNVDYVLSSDLRPQWYWKYYTRQVSTYAAIIVLILLIIILSIFYAMRKK